MDLQRLAYVFSGCMPASGGDVVNSVSRESYFDRCNQMHGYYVVGNVEFLGELDGRSIFRAGGWRDRLARGLQLR